MARKKPSAKKLVEMFLIRQAERGDNRIRNSDMHDVREYARDSFNIVHNASTYERAFRKLRAEVRDNGHPRIKSFREVQDFDSSEKILEYQLHDSQSSMFG